MHGDSRMPIFWSNPATKARALSRRQSPAEQLAVHRIRPISQRLNVGSQVFWGWMIDALASVPRSVSVIPLTLQDGLLAMLMGGRGVAPPRAGAGKMLIGAIGLASVYVLWNYYVWSNSGPA